MKSNVNRREFFKTIASLGGLTLIAPAVVNTLWGSRASAEERRRRSAPESTSGAKAAGTPSMPLVDPKDSVAKAVKYTEDHSKSPEAKGNVCKTCGFYANKGTQDGKEVGTCTIFANKLVVGNGWCASWNKKA